MIDASIYVCSYPNSTSLAGCDTRSFLKRSATGLNAVFSFILTRCLTKAKEPILPYYLFIDVGEQKEFSEP